jgi:hypothetical protein
MLSNATLRRGGNSTSMMSTEAPAGETSRRR